MPTPLVPDPAGKPVSLQDISVTGSSMAETTWSMLDRIDSKQAINKPRREAAELVPTMYHHYLDMLKNPKPLCFPTKHKYNFKFKPMPDVQPPVSRVILLSPADTEALDKMVDKELARTTMK